MPVSRLEDRLEREYRKKYQAALDIAKAQKMSPAKTAEFIVDWQNRFAAAAAPRRRALAEETMGLAEEGGVRGAARTGAEFFKGLGSSVSLGLTDVGQAYSGADPLFPLRGMPASYDLEGSRLALEAQAANSPMARGLGELGGVFTPGGGPFRIGKLAEKATGKMLLPATLALTRSARPGFAKTVGKIAVEGVRGALAGSGAAVGTTAIEGLLAGKDREQIASELWLPLAFGTALGGTVGAVAGVARTKGIDTAGMKLRERMKRLAPGFKFDPTFLRQGSMLQSIFRYSANAPIGRSIIRPYYQEAYVAPLREAIAGLRQSISGGTTGGRKAAARAVRQAVGPEGEKSGVLQKSISATHERAFAAEGDLPISNALMDKVIDGLAKMDTKRFGARAGGGAGTAGVRADKLSGLMGEIRGLNVAARMFQRGLKPTQVKGLTSGAEIPDRITVYQLENLKQRARDIAAFEAQARASGAVQNVYSKADVREARRLYALISEAERSTSSMVDRAHRSARPLRQLQAELRPLVPEAAGADDLVLLDKVFTGKNPMRRLQALHAVMPPEGRQRIAGEYFADFLEQVTRTEAKGPDRLLSNRARALFGGHGRFRNEMFEAVVGAGDPRSGRYFRETVVDIMDTMDRASAALGAAEGSPTASYLLSAAVETSVVRSLELVHQMLSDPRIAVNRLEQVGGAAFAATLLNSMLDGKLARQLEKLATGLPAGAATLTPTALSRSLQGSFNPQIPEELR